VIGATGAEQPADRPDRIELTLLATTDTHGHVFNWDYFGGEEYASGAELGLSRVGAVVDEVRAEKGDDSVIAVDNGDAIQGPRRRTTTASAMAPPRPLPIVGRAAGVLLLAGAGHLLR
jgi:2',3'-cyclic-nucleotide 2'-phosphodiesterase (5'-nucleotidase family)